MQLPALLRNHDRQTDRSTDRLTNQLAIQPTTGLTDREVKEGYTSKHFIKLLLLDIKCLIQIRIYLNM